MNTKTSEPRRPRWWPLAILTALVLALWLVVTYANLSGQNRTLATILVAILAVLLFWSWLLVLSRLAWRTRFVTLALTLLPLAAAPALLRVDGFTGDLVPILAWRWHRPEVLPAPEITEEPSDAIPEVAALGFPVEPSAHDYPQFLGPDRNATLRGIRLARDWGVRPPRLIWRRPVGAGWSSFAVAGEYAVTQEQRGEFECVVCYGLRDGSEVWAHADRARFEETLGGEGPRATPTIHRGNVYSLGATGILNALEGATGRLLWRRDILADNNAENSTWGKSSSPLVGGRLVVVSAGGGSGKSLVAYDRESGEPVWQGGDDRSGYSSPLLTTLAGRQQLVIFNRTSVAAHDPADGQVIWSYPWSRESQNVSQPVPIGADRLLVSSGYGVGSALLELRDTPEAGFSATAVWRSRGLKAKLSNVVKREDFAYGLDDGILVCLDLADGERRWKGGRYGHGQLILVEDVLLVQAESGEVALVEPTPEAHRELTRFQAIEGKTWNHPALAGYRLLSRNHREAACYELPAD